MASENQVGNIVYQVEMNVARLIEAQRQVNDRLDRMEGGFNSTGRAAQNTERSFASLSRVAGALMAVLSVQQVAAYADAWTQLNNKVSNSIRTGETQADVMQRIFDISQSTQSSLNGTATLYARLERGTRNYNTSAQDLAKLTTIINQGFAVSGATTQEAENAIVQLSQGLAAGALRGEEFNSVSEQGSRLMIALADSLGVNLGQLRKMAAEGKLTTDVIVNGLLSQGDVIGKEFAKTTVTISQGLLVAGNNITKFFGENSTVKSFAAGFRDSVISISENLDVLSGALVAVAAVMGGRFVGALTMATAAQASKARETFQGIIATRQLAQQEAAAASVTARKAVADKEAALSALNLATAEYNVAKGSAAEAIALENVIRLRAIYVATSAEAAIANNALSASQARVAATGITMANAWKAVTVATAPLGGPLGAIAIVAAGWYLYSQRQSEARKEAIAFANTVPEVIKRLKDMNLAQAEGVRGDTVTSIKAQKEAISDLSDTISELQSDYEKYTTLAKQYGVTEDQNNGFVIKARDAANELAKKRRDLDGATATLKQTEDALHLINIQVNQGIVDQMRAAKDNAIAITEAEKQASFLGGTQAFLAEKLGKSTQALKAFNSESLKINWGGKDGEKLIKQAERRLALSKLEGEAKARQQAEFDAEDAGIKDDRAIKKLQDNYAATERNTQARKDQKKEDKAAASEANKLANQAESINQKLANLKQQTELAAGSTQELSREQAMLRAEQSLGSAASESQIKQARDYAAATWDAAAAIKARNAIPELKENADYTQQKSQLEMLKSAKDANGNLLITQDQFNQQSEQLEANHQANLAKIRADAAVTPTQQSAALVDPVQALANENARKLALIQQFETKKGEITQRGLELMNAANTQYEQQRIAAQWEIWRNQNIGNEAAAASFDAFTGSASNALTGIISGSMSASDAMQSLGNTVLNSLINTFVQMGAEWVRSAVMGSTAQISATAATTTASVAGIATTTAASTTAAGTTLAAWLPAALVASVGSFGAAAIIGGAALVGAFALSKSLGKRKNGGPVSAGGMYQVGESGLPEIYQASSGRQYMIPGDNGKVISNKDLQGSGGMPNVSIQFIDQSTGRKSFDAQSSMNGDTLTVTAFISDLEEGGPMSQSITRNTTAARRANG